MAFVWSDNITSPLGDTSEENYLSVKAGKSGIKTYAPDSHGIPEGFAASLMFSDFKHLALASAQKAVSAAGIDVANSKVVFILSSTKGQIEESEDISLGETASDIARQLGIPTLPIVVCNACISGLSALILASRLLEMGRYDYAIVCGADTPGRFIISGFQSLKALSFSPCRPFDMERFGLNLGEAAATIVLGKEARQKEANWQLTQGFVKNDAYHISAPSKTGEGLYKALTETLEKVDKETLGFINAHGTATLFNDQMEAIAIQRAGLSEIPITALKGYFGHTLGAAGVLETILSMKAADDHTLVGTYGFEELGVSGHLNISADHRPIRKQAFIKMLSGFGGCNATLLAKKSAALNIKEAEPPSASFRIIKPHHVRITPQGAWCDGVAIHVETSDESSSLLTAIYKQKIKDYPKFYKMDGLSRLGFVASELLLQAEGTAAASNRGLRQDANRDDRAVILFNRTSSISSDRKYRKTIQRKEDYFPSPSLFVYTLPNIVTGEIAIRNSYHGETAFYILPEKDETQMAEILETAFIDPHTQSVLTGWIDYEDAQHFEADLYLAERG